MKRLAKFAWFLLCFSSHLWAQADLAVTPMSAFTLRKDDVLNFVIQNTSERSVRISFTPHCDIDGKLYDGKECENFLTYRSDDGEIPASLPLAPLKSLPVHVTIKDTVKHFALFKPVIAPIADDGQPPKGVLFVFNFQPGTLFLLTPESPTIAAPAFKAKSGSRAKIGEFDLDITPLKLPQVASISTKIIRRSDKQMIRFVRLGDAKILDPRRQHIILEAEYGGEKETDQVCYQMYLQFKAGEQKGVQQFSNCGF